MVDGSYSWCCCSCLHRHILVSCQKTVLSVSHDFWSGGKNTQTGKRGKKRGNRTTTAASEGKRQTKINVIKRHRVDVFSTNDERCVADTNEGQAGARLSFGRDVLTPNLLCLLALTVGNPVERGSREQDLHDSPVCVRSL